MQLKSSSIFPTVQRGLLSAVMGGGNRAALTPLFDLGFPRCFRDRVSGFCFQETVSGFGFQERVSGFCFQGFLTVFSGQEFLTFPFLG